MTTEKGAIKRSIKKTPARKSFLGLFVKRHKPLSAEEIAQNIPSMDRATVYRNIKTFVKEGILIPVNLNRNEAYYELATGHHHHHVICESCGKIEDVEKCIMPNGFERGVLLKSNMFKTINRHAVDFYGLCKSCSR